MFKTLSTRFFRFSQLPAHCHPLTANQVEAADGWEVRGRRSEMRTTRPARWPFCAHSSLLWARS